MSLKRKSFTQFKRLYRLIGIYRTLPPLGTILINMLLTTLKKMMKTVATEYVLERFLKLLKTSRESVLWL